MLSRTHLAFGLLIGLYLIDFLKIKTQISFILILLFFTIFPDMDEGSSKISKKSRPFSYISNLTGHRSIFHTIYFPLAISLAFYMFNLRELSIASLAGYFLHLILDSTTKQGIVLFYPISKKRINGFIKVGSLTEKILFIIILLLIVYKLIN